MNSAFISTSLISAINLTAILCSAMPANAVDFRLNSVTSTWNNPIGSPDVTGIDTNEIRWGIPQTGSSTSGLRFDSTLPSTTVNNTSNFVLGQLTHFNFPSSNPLSAVDLNIGLNLDNNVRPNFRYKFSIDETSNDVVLTSCPSFQQTSIPCDDKITFSSSNAPASFSVDGEDYTLKLVGFSSTPDGSNPISQFVTEENKNNRAFLVAQITTPQAKTVSEPTTIVGLLIPLVYFGYRRKKHLF